MNIVQCPKCTLRFEPDENLSYARTDVFCPQCGNRFVDENRAKPKQNAAHQNA